jgi:XTP/dITP diphosphohydrolase
MDEAGPQGAILGAGCRSNQSEGPREYPTLAPLRWGTHIPKGGIIGSKQVVLLYPISMPIQLFVATSNPGKLRDFHVAAAAHAAEFSIAPLPNMGTIPDAPEDGATFAENACSKALYYGQLAPECIVLADDSGLEVDALDGRPGVRSARYALDAGFMPDAPGAATPPLANDVRNNLFLLEELRQARSQDRRARYRCVLAAAHRGEIIAQAEGTVEGEVFPAPRGAGGFGYDPLFYLPQLARTMAEMDLETKHAISHRGRAMRSLLALLDAHLLLRGPVGV